MISSQPTKSLLSSAQKRLWILSKFDRVPYLYHVPLILKLPLHSLAVNKLKLACEKLLAQHPLLSVSFVEEKDEVLQQAQTDLSVPVLELAITTDLHEVINLEENTTLTDFFLNPFDLSCAPLFRVAIVRSEQAEYLCLAIHHLIVDAWSAQLMFAELSQIYNTLGENQSEPATKSVHYFQYIEWEQQKIANNDYQANLQYWESKLKDQSWMIDLSIDYPRRKYLSGKGSNEIIALDNDIAQLLPAFARKHLVTVNHVLLACFQILLGRYSNQEQIYVGMPLANRMDKAWQKTLGLFVNTYLHGTTLDYQLTFAEHLQKIKAEFLADMPHFQVPYDYLLHHLYQKQLCQAGASFNVLYNFVQTGSVNALQFGAHAGESIFCLVPISKFDLSLHVMAGEKSTKLIFEYSTEIFQRKTIQQMQQHFIILLKALLQQSDQPIATSLWQLNHDTD